MNDYDAIVIGSGAGGLTAALCLAQAGKKVLCLEQHYVPGGWCHSFTIGGYRFSPGVHYIGELGPGGRMRAMYEGLGVANDMTFMELNPDGFDHVRIGEERFDIPKGLGRYRERLKSRFPHETEGIDGFFELVCKVNADVDRLMGFKAFDVLTLPFRAPTLARFGMKPLDRVLDRYIKDPFLRAILSIQAGDHGMAPTAAPFALHAAVMGHYFGGGYFPKGGGFAIPRAFCRAFKRAGGELRVRTSVEKIILERGRAVGVRLAGGEELRAKTIISNADPHVTYLKLVGQKHLSPLLRWRLKRTGYSVSALSLFLAVDMDLRAGGMDSGNYWYSRTAQIGEGYDETGAAELAGDDPMSGFFVTATTLKDPTKMPRNGHHTLEAFTLVSYDSFRRWVGSRYGDRPEDYAAMKRTLTKRMVQEADRQLPGLAENVTFAELGTPLTNVHYVAATRGNLYGTEKSRWQIGPFGYGVKTGFRDLYLCGASTVGHGVMGATLSGLVCAKAVLGCEMEDLLQQGAGQELKILSSEDPETWPEDYRLRAARNQKGGPASTGVQERVLVQA